MGDDDDEDDLAIVKSKAEQEYAKRFIDYDEKPDFALLRSTEQLQFNRQSVCQKFLLKKSTMVEPDKKSKPDPTNPFTARDKSPTVKEDEVTDILDDNDLIAPLMQSRQPKDQKQPKTQSSIQTPSKATRTQWSTPGNLSRNSLDDSADIKPSVQIAGPQKVQSSDIKDFIA